MLYDQIEKLRENLYELIRREEVLNSEDILEISRKLDVLVCEYEKAKIKD
ncbi:MAG: Spo0E family sporulation regulatory protein-aspartic acid phosphatase [Clostridia bacterium]